MSSGRAHTSASLALAIPTFATFWIGTGDLALGLLAGAGCVSGVLLTPDLDQEGIGHGEWRLVKRVGPIGFLWMAYWWFYAAAIPHRSPWSHLPLFGTVLRLVYLLLPPLLVVCIFGVDVWPFVSDALTWKVLFGAFCGLCVSDTAHFIMDALPRIGGR